MTAPWSGGQDARSGRAQRPPRVNSTVVSAERETKSGAQRRQGWVRRAKVRVGRARSQASLYRSASNWVVCITDQGLLSLAVDRRFSGRQEAYRNCLGNPSFRCDPSTARERMSYTPQPVR